MDITDFLRIISADKKVLQHTMHIKLFRRCKLLLLMHIYEVCYDVTIYYYTISAVTVYYYVLFWLR